MRDPNRIKPLLERLEKVWAAVPDQRLGQLLMNASNGNTWHMECEEAVASLEKQFLKPQKLNVTAVVKKASYLYPTLTCFKASELESGVVGWFSDYSTSCETFIKKENGKLVESYYQFLGNSTSGPWNIKIDRL